MSSPPPPPSQPSPFTMVGSVQRRMAWINVNVGSHRSGTQNLRHFVACIDTGATATTIKDKHAQAMGLRLLRPKPISTAAGPVILPVYAMFILVVGEHASMQMRRVIEVVGAPNVPVDMLYGMDMLSGGEFTMELDAHGNGQWSWQETP